VAREGRLLVDLAEIAVFDLVLSREVAVARGIRDVGAAVAGFDPAVAERRVARVEA
jgi:hypothetical protein